MNGKSLSKLVFLSDVLSGGDHAGTEFIFSLLNDVPQHRLVLIMVELADEFKIAEDEIEQAGGRGLKSSMMIAGSRATGGLSCLLNTAALV